MSPTIMESVWNWYLTSVFGRVQAQSNIIAVGTRWGFNDWYGRIQEMSKKTGEKWEVIRYPALAEKNDPLGRKEGEPLCPDLVALQDILTAKIQGGHWFDCVYQQKPIQEDGRFFTPGSWPLYEDLGNLWSIMRPGEQRKFIPKDRCMKIVAADWAWSEKETGDNTAIGAGALTDDGDLLLLDVVNEQFPPEGLAPEVDRFCEKWHPSLVGIEEGHPTLRRDLERQGHVPSRIHWLKPQGSRSSGAGKMARAMPAMTLGQNGKIFLPAPESGLNRPWMDAFTTQLKHFSGVDQGPATDDMVDMLAYMARLAEQYRPRPSQRQQDLSWATPLIPPRETGWR
jgi:predicted phage terminase large subunit-like protein